MEETEAARDVFGPFQEMWNAIVGYLPSLASGLLILILGFAVGWLVRTIVARLVILARIDRLLRNLRWARGLAHADARHAVAGVLGNIVAAIVFLVFLDSAVLVWRLNVLANLIGWAGVLPPEADRGLIVLLVGSAVATAVSERIRRGLAVEGIARAELLAKLVRWGLMIVVTAVTLEEMAIAPRTVNAAFAIGMGTLGLLLALAVGLGSRGAVDRIWRAYLDRPPRTE